MTPNEQGLDLARKVLKIAFGATAFLAGLDKFVGLLADWPAYLAPWMASLLPVSPAAFMKVVGVVEMAAGLLVLSNLTRLGARVVAAWLALIALTLVSSGRFLDVAVRDLVMACGAYALARLSDWSASRVAR
jgi:uncharacterized membrane protein YphA (DoxX/SURF4 family)